jgi:hypothetical protein
MKKTYTNFSCYGIHDVKCSSQKKNQPEFNKWSIELAGGFNKPQRPMSVAARTAVVSPYVADLGVRYMFNKFGIKADFGYNSFTNGDDSKVLIILQSGFTSCCKLRKNHEFRNLD